jgi:hypothetical protein
MGRKRPLPAYNHNHLHDGALITPREAAIIFRINEDEVRKAIWDGILLTVPVGTSSEKRTSARWVLMWLDERARQESLRKSAEKEFIERKVNEALNLSDRRHRGT